jgi:hypothetical protein
MIAARRPSSLAAPKAVIPSLRRRRGISQLVVDCSSGACVIDTVDVRSFGALRQPQDDRIASVAVAPVAREGRR